MTCNSICVHETVLCGRLKGGKEGNEEGNESVEKMCGEPINNRINSKK